MAEIKFKDGSWHSDDIRDIKDLTKWCNVKGGVIEKGVCMTHGSELAFDDRITIKMPYGYHIPLKDEHGNKGNTKNIDYIGARSIFGVDYDAHMYGRDGNHDIELHLRYPYIVTLKDRFERWLIF